MRPIDADAFRDWWLYNGENEHIYDTNDILDSIDNWSPITSSSEWVSVKEKLPEDRGDVLVMAYWHACWQIMIGWYSEIHRHWRIITRYGEKETTGVTHWMSLPVPPDRRPPEEEEEAKDDYMGLMRDMRSDYPCRRAMLWNQKLERGPGRR